MAGWSGGRTRVTELALKVAGLCKRFGAIQAVDAVELEVACGRIHAIIGPNGAGKTTLLSVLSGELRAERGHIWFDKRDISRLGFAARAQCGLVRSFQLTSVVLPMTLRQNVALAVQSRLGHSYRFWAAVENDAEINRAAQHALAQVGLDARGAAIAAQVSHGEQRQLELAMALALQPKCLLLDEPFAGMGRDETAAMVQLLQRLRGELTLLLVEHDMDAVFCLADSISVLVNGAIIATGTPAAIRANAAVQRAYLGEWEG